MPNPIERDPFPFSLNTDGWIESYLSPIQDRLTSLLHRYPAARFRLAYDPHHNRITLIYSELAIPNPLPKQFNSDYYEYDTPEDYEQLPFQMLTDLTTTEITL